MIELGIIFTNSSNEALIIMGLSIKHSRSSFPRAMSIFLSTALVAQMVLLPLPVLAQEAAPSWNDTQSELTLDDKSKEAEGSGKTIAVKARDNQVSQPAPAETSSSAATDAGGETFVIDTDKTEETEKKPEATAVTGLTPAVKLSPVEAPSGTAPAENLSAGSVFGGTTGSLLQSATPPQLGESPESVEVLTEPTVGTQTAVTSASASGTFGTADSLQTNEVHQLGASINDTSKDSVLAVELVATGDEPFIIDLDEVEQIEKVVEYENLPTDEGKTKIKTGARFPVVVLSQISSKTAKKGDPVEARLKYDLKIGDRLIAKKGSVVRGHINYCLRARSVMHSLVSPERWYRNSGCLGVDFDEILNEKNEHIPLVACPARTARVVNNKAEGRLLGVNHLGQVTGPWSQQLKYKALRVGLNAALAPAGVFSFGAMPVALGLIGAANPSFAFMKPVGTNVRHRRIKGFAWGFLSGVPGSFLIEDTIVKGQEAIIKPGDEFLAEFKQEFTGEVATEAQLMPNANTKVKGDVRGQGKSDKAGKESKKSK
ncbi:MAG: hypothetical protein IPK73_17430 [Candidatus Obscuribacter sp.]|nr:hypothetical protein [Candidatus Obscuribacter sp.]